MSLATKTIHIAQGSISLRLEGHGDKGNGVVSAIVPIVEYQSLDQSTEASSELELSHNFVLGEHKPQRIHFQQIHTRQEQTSPSVAL